MKRLLLLLLRIICIALPTYAYDVEIDGICYDLINKTGTAEVVSNPHGYKGDISIPSVIMADGVCYKVSSIGEQAFYNCHSITSLSIPSSIISIGNSAFWNCYDLDKIYISDLRAWCNIDFKSDYSNPLREYCHFILNGEEIENLIIPEGITTIKNYAFSGGGFLSVSIPSSVEEIGKGSFSWCYLITSIVLPESIKEIGDMAFWACENLSSINIPANITKICDGSFGGTALESVSLPEGVTIIDQNAFASCASLQKITLPENLSSIGKGAFYNCLHLKEISIPNKIAKIDDYTFQGCEKLEKTSLGSSVRSIGRNAFYGCKELSDFYCYPERVPNTDNTAFNGSYIEYVTLHVPYGTSNLYLQSAPWNQFGSIEEMAKTKFQLIYLVDGEIYKTYEIKEGETIPVEPYPTKEGYLFSGWSDIPATMPSHDVTITGTFTANNYKLTYVLDWQEVESTEVTFDTAITPKPNPTKEGYQFTGWSCLPEKMPAHDVTIYGAFYQPGKFMYGFRWDENEVNSSGAPQITLAVGEKHRLLYSYTSSEMPDDIFYLTQSGNWVAYERKYLQGLGNTDVVVDCPEVFSISPNGVITAHKEGLAALKPTGYIQMGDGSERCYIKVVANHDENEPNNDISNANELIIAPTKFRLQNIADQDYFKVKAKVGDKITFKVVGSPNSHLGYKWATFSPSGMTLGSGGLLTDETTEAREITIDNNLTQNFGSGYYYLQLYFDQSLSQYFTSYEYLTVQAFVNDEPIQQKLSFKLKYEIDGNEYLSHMIEEGEAIIPEPAPTKEGYTFSGWSNIPATMPAHDVTVTGTFTVNKYKLAYMVNGQVYKTTDVEYGTTITPEPAPTKEGHTFSGWSEIPATMPAHDVTVTGLFTVNKYLLTYIVDGQKYKTYEVEYGAAIKPEAEPTKEGFTFSGWSEIPATMPAHVVIVTGTFTVDKYKLTYLLNGEIYKQQELEFGAVITPEPAIEQEGHTFSGWSEIPTTMPAHDVTVTGTLTVNKYILTYILDGREYKTLEVEYGTAITPETEPKKEGYTFSGWIGLPETMPARLVIVTGTFSINSYTLTYMIDDEVYKQVVYEYGATITPEPQPEGEYKTFEWVDVPETMPAHDVTVKAVYETGIDEIMMMVEQGQARIYSPSGKPLDKPQRGLNIVVGLDGTTRKFVVK